MELYQYTASELAVLLREHQCSAVEIVQSIYHRIDAVENSIDAFITLTRQQALKQAKQADAIRSAGDTAHELLGIPLAIKDNICTKGIRTTCASKMLENFTPPYNATVMDKLEQCGVVPIGKLNMDEFAMGASNETSYFKQTKNPHDLMCVPGGSSGGSAACVSAGEVPLSLGSDTGGSIRLPASYCGVAGLKPTYGSVSRYGLVAFASSLDQIGPIGRSISDVAMLYTAICGHDPRDATSANRSYPDFKANLKADVTDKVIGIPEEFFGDGVADQVKERVYDVAKLLEKKGAIIESISLPSTDYALNAYYIISSAEASSNLARFDGVKYGYRTADYNGLTDLYEKSRSEGFGDEVKRRILLGTFVLSSGYYDAYYKRAKLVQQQIAKEFEAQFSHCDMILTPTAPDTAFKLGQNIGDPIKMYLADLCTATVNIAGLPALSIPCGMDSHGLPVGCQLIGNKFSEQVLLNAAFCYEQESAHFCSIATL